MKTPTEKICVRLWFRLQETAAVVSERQHTGQFTAIDRIAEKGWLDNLLAEETRNESQHRRLAPGDWVAPFPARVGAMVTLLSHIAEGAKRTKEPGCDIFFVIRPSAAWAQSIGWLLRNQLSEAWIAEAAALDYSALMTAGGGSHALRAAGE